MDNDRLFYQRRLKEELRRAQTETDEGLRALHSRWAGLYRQRLEGCANTAQALAREEPRLAMQG